MNRPELPVPNDAVRLCTVREALGLSQREFAKELGVAASSLSQWEAERSQVPGPVLRLLDLYEEKLGLGAALPKPSVLQRSSAARAVSTAFAGALWAMFRGAGARQNASSFERSIRDAAFDRCLRTFGDMKGLSMKFGQFLANFDAIHGDASSGTALRATALQAKPMTPSALVDVFLREKGKTPRELFAEWENAPLFAASIGQVHRATLHDGQHVMVKVQYPGIVDSLQADLRNLELLDRLLSIMVPSQRPGVIFSELAERFSEECDYGNEVASIGYFSRFFEGRTDIRIPRVVEHLSSRRILTMERAEGRSFDEFARLATQAERNRAGQAIWEFFYEPTQVGGRFHADPHDANLVFQRDSVMFLDFGRVGQITPSFLEQWRMLARAVLEKERSRALELFARMGFTRSASASDGDDMYRLTLTNMLPWLAEEPFTFTPAFGRKAWRASMNDGVRTSVSFPRDTVLWTQLLFGVFALLAPLRCSVDARGPMLRCLYGPDEKRPAPYTRDELALLGLLE